MRIGYAKIGRSMQFDGSKAGFQGNPTVKKLLVRLAERNPQHTFVLVGKNDSALDGMPANIENPWAGHKLATYGQNKAGETVANPEVRQFEVDEIVPMFERLDGLIIHAGQHGTSHMPIPPTPATWKDCELGYDGAHLTKPFIWARNYGGYLVEGMNLLGDTTQGKSPVVYVCEDSRNQMKARDVKWPTGEDFILSQYQFTKDAKHQRFHDPNPPGAYGFKGRLIDGGEVWLTEQRYDYGGLEFMTLDDNWPTWGTTPFDDRVPVGIGTTSHARGKESERRSILVREYILNNFPDAEVQGKFDDKSLEDLPEGFTLTEPDPRGYGADLGRWRVTLALPIAGTAWSTAKPWQCYAARSLPYHVSRIDDQGWMLPSRTRASGTKGVGVVHGTTFYSVRDDWTPEELKLARWTRVNTPEEFVASAKVVTESKDLWTELTEIGHNMLQRRWDEWLTESIIEQRLGL